ncbi:MAG TPA: helix-turn-helix domain-containing protein [Clostridium sp.]|uniref:AraC family transcriptional regulator n=1 Tax=Clostridium sp. TaxID=1506 RepID=UPI002F91FC8A
MSIKPCGLKIAEDKRELETRGTPMFPCGGYFSDISKGVTGDIPWHWHDEIELLVVHSGAVCLSMSKMSYTLHKGEGAFINSGVLHSAQIEGNDGCILNSFVFRPSLIYGEVESIIEQRYMRPLSSTNELSCIVFHKTIEWQAQTLHCIQSAYDAFQKEEFGYELLVWENLSHVCYLIIQNMLPVLEQQKQGENMDSVRVKQMLNFIHKSYGESLGLKQIADVSIISKRECLRCFQSILGMSPMQYLIKYRISVAARLLRETDESITEICNRCGFVSPSYFSKMFKRFIDCTPTSYRKILY